MGKGAAGVRVSRVFALAGAVVALASCASLFRRADPASRLIGEWRLDSLAFYAAERNLPESTRELLTRYQQTTRTAARQFRQGEVVITTRYRPDSTYDYTVMSRDPAQRGYRERGRWRLDRARGRIWCRNQAGRGCPHDRAVVERVTERELVLHLELTGRGAGLAEYFRLLRVGP